LASLSQIRSYSISLSTWRSYLFSFLKRVLTLSHNPSTLYSFISSLIFIISSFFSSLELGLYYYSRTSNSSSSCSPMFSLFVPDQKERKRIEFFFSKILELIATFLILSFFFSKMLLPFCYFKRIHRQIGLVVR